VISNASLYSKLVKLLQGIRPVNFTINFFLRFCFLTCVSLTNYLISKLQLTILEVIPAIVKYVTCFFWIKTIDFPSPTQLMIIKYQFRYNARAHYLPTEKWETKIWGIYTRLAVSPTLARDKKLVTKIWGLRSQWFLLKTNGLIKNVTDFGKLSCRAKTDPTNLDYLQIFWLSSNF
jgi:hypothetical protein